MELGCDDSETYKGQKTAAYDISTAINEVRKKHWWRRQDPNYYGLCEPVVLLLDLAKSQH